MTNKLTDREYDILRLTITGVVNTDIPRVADFQNALTALGFDAEPMVRVFNESAQRYITILDKLAKMQLEARKEKDYESTDN
jgi:hypothetical protein